MSGAAEAVILAPMFDFLDEAAAVALEASTVAAYKAARHLPDLYNEAMREFRGRAESDLQGVFDSKRAHDARVERALELVALTQHAEDTDSNSEFLRANLQKLRARLDGGDEPSAPFSAQLDALETQVVASPSEIAAHWREFERLQGEISSYLLKRAAQQTAAAVRPDEKRRIQIDHLSAELDTLEAQLNGPLWSNADGLLAKSRLQERLTVLRSLLESEPASVAQGLVLLQSALSRARDALTSLEESRRRKVEERAARVRELSGAVVARSQALSSQDVLPEVRDSALEMLGRLPQILASDLGDDLTPLQQLADEAEALFHQAEKTLHDTAFAGYVRAQVTDVLGELGYRVTQLDGDGAAQSLVAVVDAETGVEIRIDGQGSLSSNLVVFSNSETATPVNLWAQERCCALLDEVYAGLRRRQLTVKEKKRKTLRSSDRVKTMPKSVLNREESHRHEAEPAARSFD